MRGEKRRRAREGRERVKRREGKRGEGKKAERSEKSREVRRAEDFRLTVSCGCYGNPFASQRALP